MKNFINFAVEAMKKNKISLSFRKGLGVGFLLLTLGVGQMWGYTFYLYTGDYTNWENDDACFVIYTNTNITMESLGDHWYSAEIGGYTDWAWIKRCAPNCSDRWNEFSFQVSSSNYKVKVTGNNSGEATSADAPGEGGGGGGGESTSTTFYFDNSVTSWSEVYLYLYNTNYWEGNGSGSQSNKGCYASCMQMSLVSGSSTIYEYTYEGAEPGYVCFLNASQSNYGNFWNGSKGVVQGAYKQFTDNTKTLYTPTSSHDDRNNVYYYNSGSWSAYAPNRTLTYGVGTGYSSMGSISSVYDNTSSSAVGASPASVGNGHSVTFTASPNSYYEVAGFYSDASCTSSLQSGNSTTYTTTISGNTSVYVKFKLIDYTITYKDQGNVTYSGNNSASLIKTYNYGTGVATLVAGTKNGYTFDGWYTSTDCSTGLTTSISSSATGDTTFYAKWTEKTYSLTFSHNGHGTISVGGSEVSSGSTASVNHITTKALVAEASSGYHFTGWTVSGTNNDKVTIADKTSTGTSTTIKATAAGATVTAGFAADDVNSLTVSAGTGISSVTGSTSPVTLGSKYDISATAATGYTFSTWTASPVANGTFDNASSASTKVQVNNGSVTVTASATENMSSLSVSRTIDEGTPSIAAPTVTDSRTTVGYVTTAEITAADAATGYALTSWTITNGTRTDGGGATANPITVRSNGNASESVTVAANYTIQSYTISASNSNVTYSPSSGTSFKFGATGKKMTITPKSGYKITGITSNNVAISASADNNAAGSWTVTGTMPAANVTLTVTTASVPEIKILGRMRIYDSTRSTYTTVNGSNMNWETTYANSHISMTYNYITGYYDLATYRSAAELTADTEGGGLYFYPSSSSTRHGTSTNGNVDVPSSYPGSANVYNDNGGGNFHFNSNADLINVVLHFDKENYKFWFTGEEETLYSTTFYAGDHGSINAKGTAISKNSSSSVNIGTNSPISATPESGYSFDYWETSGSVTVADIYSASTTVTASAAGGTVTAHYLANTHWYLHGQIDGDQDWESGGTYWPHRWPVDRPYRGISGVYYRRISSINNGAFFGAFYNDTQKYSGDGNNSDCSWNGTIHNLVANNGHCFQTTTSFSDKWVVIKTTDTKKIWIQSPTTYYTLSKSSDHGTVTLTENSYGGLETSQFASGERVNYSITAASGYVIDDIKIGNTTLFSDVHTASKSGNTTMPAGNTTFTVTYVPIYTVTYHDNGKTSGSAPEDASSPYIAGSDVTVLGEGDLEMTNYTFSGWNTAQYMTGDSYEEDETISGISANIDLYPIWTRAIPMENEDATTDVSTTVYGTYMSTTLTDYDNPEKTGYTFGGWYTAIAGGDSYVISPEKVLQASKYHWTDASGRFDRNPTSTSSLYAKWTQTITLNANTDNHGSGDNTSAAVTYKKNALTSIAHCTPATGYSLAGYYTAETGGVKILNADGTFAGSDVADDDEDYIVDGVWKHAGATTLYAQYEPITYTVTLKPGLGGTGSDGSMTVDYDATAYTTFSHSITQTGYSISGWYTSTSVKVLNADGSFAASNVTGYITSDKWTKASNCDLYAWWTPNPYAITFDATTNDGDIVSGSSPQNVIFNETSVGSCPTAAKEGYCFDGWYTAASEGTKVINSDGSLVANVTVSAVQWTDGSGNWKKPSATTVYAVYVAPTIEMTKTPTYNLYDKTPDKDTIVIHQSLSCTPAGNYNIAYTVGYAVNHTQLAEQPTIKYGTGDDVGHDTIKMPVSAGVNMYEVVATLRTGTTRGEGDVVRRDTIRADVETKYTVKLRYMVDGVDIQESTEWYLYPTIASLIVKAPLVVEGYVLDSWSFGSGITKDPAKDDVIDESVHTKYCFAANPGTIILNYKTRPNGVYFKNNAVGGFYSTRVRAYDYTTEGYWSGDAKGSGANGKDSLKFTYDSNDDVFWSKTAFVGTTTKMSLTNDPQKDVQNFGDEGSVYVAYRTDYNSATSLFVPVSTGDDDYFTINGARYYRGFWTKYSHNIDSTGYYLKIYNKKTKTDAPYADEKDPELVYTVPLRLTKTGAGDSWELTATVDLEGGKTYGFKYTKAHTGGTQWFGNSGTMDTEYHEGWTFSKDQSSNCGLTTTSAGEYTFHIFCKASASASETNVQGEPAVTVDYATLNDDYRVYYADATQTEPIVSQTLHKRAEGLDTVSFFVRKNATSRVMKFQKFNGSTSKWDDVASGDIDLSGITKDSIYVFYVEQNEGATSISVTGHDYYDGEIYIRTDCVDEYKWDYKHSLNNHKMVETDYGMTASQPFKFSHYYVHWVDKSGNVKYVIANKYAPCLTDTVITDLYANVAGGNLPSDHGANIRFMYNKSTNATQRAYLSGTQGSEWSANSLKLTEYPDANKMQNTSGTTIDNITFTDQGNWTYTASIKAIPGLKAQLTAEYNSQTQYFKGTAEDGAVIVSGDSETPQAIDMTYDFKTNRLICAWRPSGDSIKSDISINADVMIIRKAQGDAEQIRFNNDGALSDVKYIYGVIQFDYDDMYGKMSRWDYLSYEQCMYYISFPYDVLVNDIMGAGTMGVDWRLQRYNGAKRAANGWFTGDGVTTFWEDVQPGDTLRAYEGYGLLLNRNRFNGSKGNIWDNKGEHSSVYLFFPSVTASTGIVHNESVKIHVPEHECTIDRSYTNSRGAYVNHKVTDSHWNMIGTPLFEDKKASTIVNPAPIEGQTLNYIYEWSYWTNTLMIAAVLNTSFEFKTMYSYMAQYAGDITFSGSTVNKIVAAKRNEEKKNYHVNLELTKDDVFIGRTYVELRENAVDSFLLNEDICMFRNGVDADLFTYAGGYEAGANVLPVGNHTVPVGIDVKKAGTYTFSMPSNFDGEVTLVDTYAQTRTNLLIEDYEVALNKGEITDRFYLEINVNKVPTAIDGTAGASLKDGKAHKFIEDQQMYILKNGVIYDARGQRVK